MLGGDKAGAICIPYWDGDVRVGAKHRTLIGEKKFTQEKGSAQILYNQNCLRDETLKLEPIIVTEGEVDCWTALQCGYPRTVSVPGGAPLERVKDEDGKKYRFVDECSA